MENAKLELVVRRVLLVDDNLDHIHTLSILLRSMGHSVDYAVNGYVALDVARRFRPDVVLLDLGLPGVTGLEVCEQIRRDLEIGKTKIFALTGYNQPEYRERAKGAGFDGFFQKPVDPKVLFELLSEEPSPGAPRAGAARPLRA